MERREIDDVFALQERMIQFASKNKKVLFILFVFIFLYSYTGFLVWWINTHRIEFFLYAGNQLGILVALHFIFGFAVGWIVKGKIK